MLASTAEVSRSRTASGVARAGSASAGIQLAPRMKISRPFTRKQEAMTGLIGVGDKFDLPQPDPQAAPFRPEPQLQHIKMLPSVTGGPPKVRILDC
ncbi:hypothetical protein [Hoeflea alexandrii]